MVGFQVSVCVCVCARHAGVCFSNEKTLGCQWSCLQLEHGVVGDVATTAVIKKIQKSKVDTQGSGALAVVSYDRRSLAICDRDSWRTKSTALEKVGFGNRYRPQGIFRKNFRP